MLKFRNAQLQDLPSLNRISIASKKYWGYPEEWIDHWMPDLIISEEDIARHLLQIAQIGDLIIGFFCMSEEAEYYEIKHLWILPEFIGKGFGRKLLNYSLGLLSDVNKPIQVVSDPNAEEFYKKLGFKTIGKIESYPPGRFLSVLRKG